jgi:hypothetical protein
VLCPGLFTSGVRPRYLFDRTLVETQSLSGCFGEEKSLTATGTWTLDQPAHSLVTVLTTLSWLNKQNFLKKRSPCSQLCDTNLQTYWRNSVFVFLFRQNGSCSVLGIVTKLWGWMVQGLYTGSGKRLYSSPQRPDQLSGPKSLIFTVYWGSFPGVKQPEHELNHSPPTSAKVKNEFSSPCKLAWH